MIFALEMGAVLVAVGAILWFSISPGRMSHDSATTGVSALSSVSWSSPTAFLLKSLDDRVVSAVPVIRDSVVNGLLDGRGENTSGGAP